MTKASFGVSEGVETPINFLGCTLGKDWRLSIPSFALTEATSG